MEITITPVPGTASASVRYEGGALWVNGAPWDISQPITYGEQAGCATFSDDPEVVFNVIPSEWVDPSPPAPVVAPPAVPDAVTALQGRLALGRAMCEQVAAMLPDDDWPARQAWEYATVWRRESPLLVALATAFGMTEAQVDDLFRLAVTLEV